MPNEGDVAVQEAAWIRANLANSRYQGAAKTLAKRQATASIDKQLDCAEAGYLAAKATYPLSRVVEEAGVVAEVADVAVAVEAAMWKSPAPRSRPLSKTSQTSGSQLKLEVINLVLQFRPTSVLIPVLAAISLSSKNGLQSTQISRTSRNSLSSQTTPKFLSSVWEPSGFILEATRWSSDVSTFQD
jgi:hypothetical protein